LAGAVLDPADWKPAPPLPVALTRHRAVGVGSSLLVVGGRDRFGKLQRSVFHAALSGNGSCGAWGRDPDFPVPVSDQAMAVVDQTVYCAGGLKAARVGEAPTNEVWMARPAADGAVKSWTRAGSLAEAVYAHGLASLGGRLYCLGGMGAGGYRNTVTMAVPGADGRIAEWTPVSGLPAPVAHAAVVALDHYLVVIGGQSPGEGKTLVMPTVYVGPVFPDGTVPTWYLASSKLPGAWLGFGRNQTAAAVWQNTLFCFGGQDSLWFMLDTVVASDFDLKRGELTPWGVVEGGAVMPQLTAAVVWKDFIYLIGGTVKGEVSAKVFRGHFTRAAEAAP